MIKNDSIFISIASYRDPELLKTIRDCLHKSANPKKINFGICWQKDDDESLEEFEDHPQVRIIDKHWKDSKGACWARHTIQKNLYHGEDYYLQLDSHHRFDTNWDIQLIDLLNIAKRQSIKPIVGGYATTYWPDNDKDLRNEPYRINTFDSFTDDGDIVSRPVYMADHMSRSEPLVPARLLSGHFIFADGIFSQECMYDPNYYFRGEEIVLSARAYTHGYDFYHPNKTIIWHEYLRPKQNKHWTDHTKANGCEVESEYRNIRSKERQRKLLKMEPSNIDFKQYDLGTIRSLRDYELYAGLDFQKRLVHKYCADVRGDSPDPYKMSEQEWINGMMYPYMVTIEWDLNKIPDNVEFDFWFVGFENKDGLLLYRKDFNHDDPIYQQFFNKQSNTYTIKFCAEDRPNHCVIIPYIQNQGWSDRILIKVG